MADTLYSPAKDRFPWSMIVAIFLVQLVIGVVFSVRQWREDIAVTEEDLAANLQVLETILHANLQNAQYQEIDPLLTNWINLYQDRVAHLDLTSGNGFVFFRYDQEDPSDHFTGRTATINYSYQSTAALTVRWSLAAADLHVLRTLLLLGAIQLITTLALIFFLRLATLRKRDARMLAVRAEELNLAIRDLHREMEQRAVIEKNLAKEKEQLQVTLRGLEEGVVSIDSGGSVLLLNSAAEEMLGCRGQRCVGNSIDEIMYLAEEDSESGFRIFESGYLRQEGGSTKDLVLHSRSRGKRFVSLGCSPITDDQHELAGWVVVFRDITETRSLEQEQRKNSMLQALGVLAGGIAHDFNNILMAISGNIQLALDSTGEDAEQEEILSSAERATQRAADLTRQLLTFAKGGGPILDATAIDEVVREAADFVTRGADIHVEYVFEPDLVPVLIDRHQIGQVIQNLVINARQAMSTRRRLTISCANVLERRGNRKIPMVRIEITDQGAGIPKDHLEDIFDPYYTTKQQGSGLGLAVVHSIITQHEGRIEVQSDQGEGSTFIIHLPAGCEVQSAEDPGDQPLIRGSGRILVMDDDEAVLGITIGMVRQLGFEVIGAADGARAVEIYRENLQSGHPIDMVIMDLTVPRGMGGLEAMRRLLEIDPECLAVVSSGYSNDPIMAVHRAYGFKAALVKPFNLNRLSRVLEQVLVQS